MVAGCATSRDSGRDPGRDGLVGQTLRVTTARGEVSQLRFRRDGTVRARFGGRSLVGRWQRAGSSLCFFWAGAPRECWPWRQGLDRGRTRNVTSDRGNVVRVTRL